MLWTTRAMPKELYRGDKSGLKSVGFRSFEAKSQGDRQALAALLKMGLDELERLMEDHASSHFLSWFVSTTSDIRVACYFATDGCKSKGSIYVLRSSSLARYNPFNTLDITLCDEKTVVKENEWVWFSYVDPTDIQNEWVWFSYIAGGRHLGDGGSQALRGAWKKRLQESGSASSCCPLLRPVFVEGGNTCLPVKPRRSDRKGRHCFAGYSRSV
jgi:hypothetical protein